MRLAVAFLLCLSAFAQDDVAARSQTIRAANTAKEVRRDNVLYLIEHHPDAAVLSDWIANVDRVTDSEAWATADKLWKAHLAANPSETVKLNAVHFYTFSDPEFARELSAEPRTERMAVARGMLLAFAITGVKGVDRYGNATAFEDPSPEQARKELESSKNDVVVGHAAEVIAQQLSAMMMHRRSDQMTAETAFAEHLFERALELDAGNPRWKMALASLYWTSASRTADPQKKVALLEKAIRTSDGSGPQSYAMVDLAKAYLLLKDTTKAAATANALLALPPSDGNYGNAIHNGNIVLGRIALEKGDRDEAKKRLLAAGRTPGSPVLNSFGPDFQLAQELVQAGERDAVLEYIELCRAFWKLDRGRLDTWATAIRSGGNPNFTGPPPIPTPNIVGRAAPEIKLRKLGGGEVSLADFKGKVVLVDFWATWCGPCRAEMPTFEKLHRELAAKDVAILAVDVNEPDDTVQEYIGKEKFTFPVLLSKDTDVDKRYGVSAYPTLVALDAKGLVADYLIGGRNEETLRGVIEKARKGAPPPSTVAPPSAAPATASSARPAGVGAPATAIDFYLEGVRFHNGRDFNSALKALDTAIQMDPKLTMAWEWRGQVKLDLHRLAEAIPDFTRVIELSPEVPMAYGYRGQCYLDTGKLDEALVDLNRALALNPAYPNALQSRSRLYMARKQYAEAIADCDAALRGFPNLTWAVQRKTEAQNALSGGKATAGGLSAPKLLSPAAGTTYSHYPRETTLVWAEVPGAASYVVEWDYKGGETWAMDQRGGTGVIVRSMQPTATISFIGAQPGRWRVWAVDAQGREGPRSEWREFTYTR